MTMAMCGHIFHDRCVNTWGSDLCPCCQQFMDDPTEKPVDCAGTAVLPPGTPVMLHGLMIQQTMNGSFAQIIDYSPEEDRYTVQQRPSPFLFRVRPANVVNIKVD